MMWYSVVSSSISQLQSCEMFFISVRLSSVCVCICENNRVCPCVLMHVSRGLQYISSIYGRDSLVPMRTSGARIMHRYSTVPKCFSKLYSDWSGSDSFPDFARR